MIRQFGLLLLLGLLTSCALTAPEAFYMRAPQEWSHEQKMVAFFHALRQETTVETPQGREVSRKVLKISDVYDLVARIRKDISWALSNPDFVDYLIWTGSNVSVGESDKRWDTLYKCLKAYHLRGKLAHLMGVVSQHVEEPYETKLVVACPQLAQVLDFSDKRIEEAKKEGRLVPSQLVTIEVADPQGMVTLEATTYLVVPDAPVTPEEQVSMWYKPGVYAEIKRHGEEKPIVRLYRSSGSDNLNIALVDYDPQGEYGYGLPDELLQVSVSSALEFVAVKVKDLIPRDKNVLSIYNFKRKEASPETVYVVRPKEIELEKWEVGEFAVPVDYKDSPYDPDFKVSLTEVRKDGSRKVEYFYARYVSAGVVEIYVPREEFAWVKDIYLSGGQLKVVLKDKPSVEGPPSFFGVLTYLVYKEGDKGIMLWDSDGDGNWDRRRVVVWSF